MMCGRGRMTRNERIREERRRRIVDQLKRAEAHGCPDAYHSIAYVLNLITYFKTPFTAEEVRGVATMRATGEDK